MNDVIELLPELPPDDLTWMEIERVYSTLEIPSQTVARLMARQLLRLLGHPVPDDPPGHRPPIHPDDPPGHRP